MSDGTGNLPMLTPEKVRHPVAFTKNHFIRRTPQAR
jgi:hypothetical protein